MSCQLCADDSHRHQAASTQRESVLIDLDDDAPVVHCLATGVLKLDDRQILLEEADGVGRATVARDQTGFWKVGCTASRLAADQRPEMLAVPGNDDGPEMMCQRNDLRVVSPAAKFVSDVKNLMTLLYQEGSQR